MKQLDYNEAVMITRDIFWTGFYDREANLHCNPYLLIDGDEAVIFDPGSIPHFKIVMRKVIDLVKPGSISYIIASHQDPDLCGNLAVVEDVVDNPNLHIVAHENAIRLIRHYGVKSSFYDVRKKDYALTLKSGRVLRFIHLPYLHSPGSIATFDQVSGSLFSGDLFGAISENWTLFAGTGFEKNMCIFHQIYMPSNLILKNGLKKLSGLNINRILPQHGSILEGKQIKDAFAHLKALRCGIDEEE